MGSNPGLFSHSTEVKVNIEDEGTETVHNDEEDLTQPHRKKARLIKKQTLETDIAYWKSLIKENPVSVERWEGLVALYQKDFDELHSLETSDKLEGLIPVPDFANHQGISF